MLSSKGRIGRVNQEEKEEEEEEGDQQEENDGEEGGGKKGEMIYMVQNKECKYKAKLNGRNKGNMKALGWVVHIRWATYNARTLLYTTYIYTPLKGLSQVILLHDDDDDDARGSPYDGYKDSEKNLGRSIHVFARTNPEFLFHFILFFFPRFFF